MSKLCDKNPLKGLKVIDFGQYIAGPLVAKNLVDQGATVIHIDPPEGPRINNVMTSMLNRDKENITLDLKNSNDLLYSIELIKSADIVIDGFHPETLLKLGINLKEI